jgi:hypothetical protein
MQIDVSGVTVTTNPVANSVIPGKTCEKTLKSCAVGRISSNPTTAIIGPGDQKDPRPNTRGSASDMAGEKKRQYGNRQSGQARSGRRITSDLLDVEHDDQRTQHQPPVHESGREVAPREVAAAEQVQSQHGVRRAALPPNEADQCNHADDERSGDDGVDPTPSLGFDERVHSGGQPRCRQQPAGEVNLGVLRRFRHGAYPKCQGETDDHRDGREHIDPPPAQKVNG